MRCGVATLFTEEMHAKRPAEAPTDPVLTPWLVQTSVGPDDVNDLLLLSSDPVVAYWTRAAVEAWAADKAARWTAEGVGKWMARDRSDGSLVGRGGFTRFDLDGETVLELGWAVRDARTGRGYATELGRAALAWAVEHQPDPPVVAFTEVHNRASRAVMERLGMQPAGITRRVGLVEGLTGVHPDAPFALYPTLLPNSCRRNVRSGQSELELFTPWPAGPCWSGPSGEWRGAPSWD